MGTILYKWYLNVEPSQHVFGLAKKFVRVFCKRLWENTNELFGQTNRITSISVKVAYNLL